MKRDAIFLIVVLILISLTGISYLCRATLYSFTSGGQQTGAFYAGLSASMKTQCRMIASDGIAMSFLESCNRALDAILVQLQVETNSKKSTGFSKRQRGFERLEDRLLLSVTQDANGFTLVGASADTRTIYVSSSTGNDANDGLSTATAKRTIAAGMSLMRDGMPDHLLLKRGDTFVNQSVTVATSSNGRSASEPWLISSYGSGNRPIVDSQDLGHGARIWAADFIAIIGLHFKTTTRDPDELPLGIWIFGGNQNTPACANILIEDNFIDGYMNNISISGDVVENHRDITIRRNTIVNSWNANGRSQGMYADFVDGLTIAENVFDHNGWNESIVGAEATAENHSMYITHYNKNVTINDNISSRASSMGLKFQPVEGTHYVTNNLFVRNGYGVQVGGGQASYQVGKSGATIYANNNVITEGSQYAQAAPGYGVTVSNVKSGSFSGNIITNKLASSVAPALSLQDGSPAWETRGVGVRDFVLSNNVVYNWRGETQVINPTVGSPLPVMSNIDFVNNQFQEPDSTYTGKLLEVYSPSSSVNSFAGGRYYRAAADASSLFSIGGANRSYSGWVSSTGETASVNSKVEFFDPTRSSLTYAASLGLTTYDAFISEVSLQSRTNWRTEFTADAVNDYIRAGFAHDPIGVTPLPQPSLGAPTGQSIQQQTVPQSQPQPQQQLQNFQQPLRQQLIQPRPAQGSLAPEMEDSSQIEGGVTADLLVLQRLLPATETTIDADRFDGEGSSSVSLDHGPATWESAADEVFSELGELALSM